VSANTIILKYYRTTFWYILLSAILGFVLEIMHYTGIHVSLGWFLAMVHLGVIGALTFGLFGLFLRLFSGQISVDPDIRPFQSLHWLLNSGVILLSLGFILHTGWILGIGAALVILSVGWWGIQYIRLYSSLKNNLRTGAALFGAFASVGLLITVIIGGYAIHSFMSNSVSPTVRLAHIHAGLVGWVTLGLLGLGVAFRGSDSPVLDSNGILRSAVWVWFAGVLLLVGLMLGKRFSLLMPVAGIILLGFLGYGYSMPKTGKSGSDNKESTGNRKGFVPFIVIGSIALFLTLALGFDVAANYPNGQNILHMTLGVGGWIIMMILMSLFSEVPKTVLKIAEQTGTEFPDTFLFPGIFRLTWIAVTLSLVIIMIGNLASVSILYTLGTLIFLATLAIISGFVLRNYRVDRHI